MSEETKGKELVEELTGWNDVEVVLDPTMLITSEEWTKLSKKPKQLNCKYSNYICSGCNYLECIEK